MYGATMNRQKLGVVLLAMASILGLRASHADPFKIGIPVLLTSAGAKSGQSFLNGANLFIKQSGKQVGGGEISLVSGDTQGNPNGAVAAVRKMVEYDHVNILVGLINTSEVMPIRDYVRDKKVPTVFNAAARDLTLTLGNDFLLRASYNEAQLIDPLAEWAAANLPNKRVSSLAADFTPGYEFVGGFGETFAKGGGTVIQKLWAPVGTQDFAPYLSQIDEKADALYCFFYGSDANRLVRQLNSFGLTTSKTILSNFVTEYPNLLGDAGLGIISSQVYNMGYVSPENQKFVAAYRQEFKEDPDVYSALGYTELQFVYAALKKLTGSAITPQSFVDAVQKVSIPNTIRGPLKFDDHRGIVQNIYIAQVKKVGGVYENVILKTVPSVSQFWRWSPEEFAAKKPFTR